MCSLGKHAHILGVALVNLTALQYLQAHGAVLVVGEEGTAAGLAHILYHTTYPYRAVELATQVGNQFFV